MLTSEENEGKMRGWNDGGREVGRNEVISTTKAPHTTNFTLTQNPCLTIFFSRSLTQKYSSQLAERLTHTLAHSYKHTKEAQVGTSFIRVPTSPQVHTQR